MLKTVCLGRHRVFGYTHDVTAVEIIEEIKRLPRAEQNQVIDFVQKAGRRPLAPAELGKLAEQMVEAKTPAEGDQMQAEIVQGFYGRF